METNPILSLSPYPKRTETEPLHPNSTTLKQQVESYELRLMPRMFHPLSIAVYRGHKYLPTPHSHPGITGYATHKSLGIVDDVIRCQDLRQSARNVGSTK